ncbi:alpha/beta hydrolase [Primorskyibacter sp. 2E107]|uniref:alpha/beta hydrolase n=1 Tax=Primorskyibacter sp. 2E107 TaxID=3403458 RepID=UPI003AF79CAD
MSWQGRLLDRSLRLVVKPRLRRVVAIPEARRAFRRAALAFRPTPFTRNLLRPGGLHWIGSGPAQAGRVILYFHGGGYIVGSPQTHEAMLARLALLSRVEVCAPAYRLAPETPFPGAFDDALRAWDHLRTLGYARQDIVIGGDSAGGGLALALLAELCQSGQAPAGAFAFSPWTDLALTGPSLLDNSEADAVLPGERIEELRDHYLQGQDPRDPRGSPLHAAFPDCPPVLLQCSDSEILRDDSLRMAAHLKTEGGAVTLEIEPALPHVWHLFDGWLPEARQSLSRVASFAQASFEIVRR